MFCRFVQEDKTKWNENIVQYMRNLNKRFPCFGGQILQPISSKADLYCFFVVVVLLMTAEMLLPVKIKCFLFLTFGLTLNACGGRFGASL